MRKGGIRLNSGILMGWGAKCYNFVTILLLFYSFIRYIYTLSYKAGVFGAQEFCSGYDRVGFLCCLEGILYFFCGLCFEISALPCVASPVPVFLYI